MYCRHCGKELPGDSIFCDRCGSALAYEHSPAMDACCPRCGSLRIDTQVHQENQGGTTVTKTKSTYKEQGHGCLWWLLIGWWWWIIDLMLWICFFPFRLIAQLCKRKKYRGKSSSVTTSANHIAYRTVYLCKSCGHHWEK